MLRLFAVNGFASHLIGKRGSASFLFPFFFPLFGGVLRSFYKLMLLAAADNIFCFNLIMQIPFQLGLSKTDLRKMLKSSLSGVS